MSAVPERDLDPNHLRQTILRMARAGDSVHIACAFSIVEIVSTLYSTFVSNSFEDLANHDRDYVILSKGHGVMALYAAFYGIGWLAPEHLDRYFSDGSLLHGLSEAKIPGLEVSSGSLGHGLPIAAGIALGLKRMNSARQVYCIVGDGEMNEGPMWEALLFASHQNLSNLTVIVDANGQQAMGTTEQIVGLEPFRAKMESFGLESFECDGHDRTALASLLFKPASRKPRAIIARTVKGKGVSFMENDNSWHYRRLDDELLQSALKEIS